MEREFAPNPGSLVNFEEKHPYLDKEQAHGQWKKNFTDFRIDLVRANVIDVERLGAKERTRMIDQDLAQTGPTAQ